jgi:hypothetical protein
LTLKNDGELSKMGQAQWPALVAASANV